ncbi:MAG TPA: hypothetical protein VJN02_03900 [Gammaproteobacteria bacterium]|nr:hypothetical protein [Gammaproteobacteria bacterium]
MKKVIIAITTIVVSVFAMSAIASHSVSGYYRGNGTYVQPHMSMDPGEARSSGYSYQNNELVPYGN